MHILATDLDGTFLGGSDTARRRLVEHFLETPENQLIYVTGRSVNSVESLIQEGRLPRPNGMICDVGTTVACARGRDLPGPAHQAIHEAWRDRSETVRAALEAAPGLTLQSDYGPRRVSYHYDKQADLEEVSQRVRDMGLDPLVSDGLYFDVLPPGVNKGTTLQRWLEQHGHGLDAALVAGDTLNDRALLECGASAVVVGNAEPALLEVLSSSEKIYRAKGHGCDGIVEACKHFGIDLGVAHV